MKTCIICKEELPEQNFNKDRSRKDGLNPRCRECKSKLDAKYRESHKKEIKENQKLYYKNNSDRIKERSSTWYRNNTSQHNARMKQYFQDNKTKIKAKQTEWNENNRVKIQEYINNYMKIRYQQNTNFRIKSILSARLRSCVKNKNGSTLEIIGCTLNEFKEWIEYQFDKNMSWENIGSYWHFDHVKPCSSFDLCNEQDVLECFNWKNIRPLEAKQNMSKGNVVDYNIIETHNKVVKSFNARRTKER